ncbi:phospholipase C [Streptantibioticus ferralitis]|uniref:phospholipase C n=1 Tax=Streptantibioticus ferralitis TaxID=236510 RepID=A0ABT5Z334_9ACTN|nr:alkaline phosphatase family protein [Streptantibioticus ferralitis]MDF2258209.1 alkaline phosphatase family protein [Streptantibioticus ferralitis]
MTVRVRPPGTRRRAARWGALAGAAVLAAASGTAPAIAAPDHGGPVRTATPVKHLVVIFDENISFDHYFATYPKAANTDGSKFTASPKTPKDTNNLANAGLLTKNPNQYAPQRLGSSQAMTCDQNHEYAAEQYAYNGGKADQFVQNTDSGKCSGNLFGEPGLAMDYYDGNTVTALWNYAQHYTLNDKSFGSGYGPSTPGALELISGQTHGVVSVDPASGTEHPKQTAKPDPYTVQSPNAKGVGTVINDPDPAFDDCANKDHTAKNALAKMAGPNIGDRLNAKGVSWGWFQGGFRPSTPWNGRQGSYALCKGTTHTNVGGAAVEDYSPHHNPFAYYQSTSNPHHVAPASLGEIGHSGRANHNYDLSDFDTVVKAGKLPSVSFLKAGEYQDGHAGYSDPIDEQHFLVKEINEVQKSPQWRDTAVVVAYDDSDGWYDHVYAPPLNGSKDSAKGSDGKATDSPGCQAGPAAAGGYADRCGPGTRQPLLLISPFSKVNSVDHTQTEQTSITKFIEDNWGTRRIGDGSFDQRATSIGALFDFKHPNNQQVLLNQDGSVASVKPIPPSHGGSDNSGDYGNSDNSGNAASTDNLSQQQLAETGASFPALPVGLASGVVVVAGGAIAVAVHRRRSAA